MQYNPDVVFTDHETGETLCFTHAVLAAIKRHYITIEVDEFGVDGNDMRSYMCKKCYDDPLMDERY